MRENAGMQHVRVGDHHVALFANGLPRIVWCVAVVSKGFDVCFEFSDEAVNLCHLVISQCLCGEEVYSSGLRLFKDLLEYRDVVTQGLSAGCRGDEDNVPALMNKLNGLCLVAVQFTDALPGEYLLQQRVHPVGVWGITALQCGDMPDGCCIFPETPVLFSAGQPLC